MISKKRDYHLYCAISIMPLSIPNIPDHVEVTLRISLSLILTYVLSLGSFPNTIPPSQTVVIASVASAFTMVLPTLLFSVGGAAMSMVTAVLIALIISTILLAVAATGGVAAYVAAYFCVAMMLSGLRFTSQGDMTNILLMFSALNTMSLSAVAEKEGLAFVRSLWTETGTTNPNAVFCNTLIGMCWVAVCISFARVLPPARTARHLLSTTLLPKVLKDLATFIRLTVEYHVKDDIEDAHDSDDDDDDDDDENDKTSGTTLGNGAADSHNEGSEKRRDGIDDVIMSVVQDASITLGGGVAGLTVFEPHIGRFCMCSPPVDVVTLLTNLIHSVNDMILSSLSLRAFSKAGFKEIEMDGLKDVYEQSALLLDRCAVALASSNPLPNEGDEAEALSAEEKDIETSPAFDPIRLSDKSLRVEQLTKEWIQTMATDDRTRTHFDKEARNVYVRSLKPWIMSLFGFGLLSAMSESLRKAVTPVYWKRVFLPPHYAFRKFIWCLKFAIGFTALVIMQVYWPAFANLEVPTSDEMASPHFAGWALIAYAFSTTQTVEGTWKKSALRALGTVAGGFSGWLALTACKSNPWGLGAWMTITSSLVAYSGLPKGFSSRFGLDHDLAWGPAYFAMTQALVVMEVYAGYGTKNDITVNRIIANLVGIAMAVFMATIPPGVTYGGSPCSAQFLLEDIKRAFRECIELMLAGSGTDATITNDDLSEKLFQLHANVLATFTSEFDESNKNFIDATQLASLPILKVDARMKAGLDTLAILGCSVLSLIRFGACLPMEPSERFGQGSEERKALEKILHGLDIVDDPRNISGFYMHHDQTSGAPKHNAILSPRENEDQRVVPAHTTFVHFCIYLCHYIMQREIKFDAIQYGFVGEKMSSLGTRTTLPPGVPLLSVFEGDKKQE